MRGSRQLRRTRVSWGKMKTLHADQREAIKFLYERDHALLFADIGTGKTVIALTVMQLWRKNGFARRAIVFAPSRVCNDVWWQEIGEWPHLRAEISCAGDMVESVAGKSVSERRRILEDKSTPIVCVNYENIPWLLKTYPDGVPGVDVLWFDEVDKMKSPTSLRFKGRGRKGTKTWKQGMRHWRKHVPIIVGMTGTPVSNGLLDLWAQVCCVDGGERLGSNYHVYQRKYFYQTDWLGYQWKPYTDAPDAIHELVADCTFRIEAHAEMAPVVYTPPRYVELPSDVMKQYKSMERQYIMEFEDADPAFAVSAAAAYNKLRQTTAGFVYTEGADANTLHNVKYCELDSLISELNGAQLLIVFHFKEQAAELKKRYGKRITCLYSGMSAAKGSDAIKAWNDGELPLFGVQPKSGGHGLNLQHSGAHHICMLTEPESAGLYNQVVGRLARKGQVNTVFVHTIHARKTIDEDRAKVVASKRSDLRATLDAIRERQIA